MKKLAKLALLFGVLSLCIFMVSCSTNEFKARRERADKFELKKVDFNYKMNQSAAWAGRTLSYHNEMPPWGPPDGELTKVSSVFNNYKEKEADSRKEARVIFISLCKSASSLEDFTWIYQSKSIALKKEEMDINKRFLRGVVDEVFANEYFKPDSNWVELRKSILGREFYTKK